MGEKDEPRSAAFYVGRGGKIDSVKIEGNVAGRDVNITASDAAQVSERAQLLELLAKLQEQVQALSEAPSGLKTDAADELGKARSAGEEGDDQLGLLHCRGQVSTGQFTRLR